MLDNEVAVYGKGFSDESWLIHRGHPKQGNGDDVIINTICVVDEEESKYSYSFDFLYVATSLSDIKPFDNLSLKTSCSNLSASN